LEEKRYWVWFTLIKDLGARKKQKLIERFKNPIEIFNLKKEQLLEIEGIGEKGANIILDEKIRKEVDYHLLYMEKNGIDIINIFDPEYPQILKEIYDHPICLYIKGNKKILNSFALAIIGCRDSSVYGEKNAEKFAFELAKRKIVIVSGLAKGIDSCAHKGTILAKEKTIAVIGNGLDFIYPSENTKLANEIIKNDGCIISEYPLGTKPEKQNFPARNRIISGISKGVLVVEAKEKSGTLITVDFALEQGRDVFALPGNINSLNSVGTNELIKQGASIVCNVEDVLQGLKTCNNFVTKKT
jgi:DNA processing protein